MLFIVLCLEEYDADTRLVVLVPDEVVRGREMVKSVSRGGCLAALGSSLASHSQNFSGGYPVRCVMRPLLRN